MTGATRLVALGPWALLVGATLAAYALAEENASPAVATLAVFAIAAGKVRLVTSHFMEVGEGSRTLRRILDLWIVLTTLIITSGYWISIS